MTVMTGTELHLGTMPAFNINLMLDDDSKSLAAVLGSSQFQPLLDVPWLWTDQVMDQVIVVRTGNCGDNR